MIGSLLCPVCSKEQSTCLGLEGQWAVCAGEILKFMRAEMAVGRTEVRRLGSSGN